MLTAVPAGPASAGGCRERGGRAGRLTRSPGPRVPADAAGFQPGRDSGGAGSGTPEMAGQRARRRRNRRQAARRWCSHHPPFGKIKNIIPNGCAVSPRPRLPAVARAAPTVGAGGFRGRAPVTRRRFRRSLRARRCGHYRRGHGLCRPRARVVSPGAGGCLRVASAPPFPSQRRPALAWQRPGCP